MTGLTRRAMLAGTAALSAPVRASRAADTALAPFRFMTNWYAQAEHAGFYQALAKGFYREAGLDVTVEHGGPQINTMQLLLAGRYDLIIGSISTTMQGIARGMPGVVVGTTFQKSLIGIIAHPDIKQFSDLAGHTILLSTEVRSALWPWLRDHFKFSDAQARPYNFSIQPFLFDPTIAMQSYETSEPYALDKRHVPYRFFPMDEITFPDYGNTLVTTRPTIAARRDDVAKFLAASARGWADWMNGDPAPGNAAIRAANPIMPEDQILWSREKFRAISAFGPPGTHYCTINDARLGDIAKFLVQSGQLSPGTKWQDACNTSFSGAMTAAVP